MDSPVNANWAGRERRRYKVVDTAWQAAVEEEKAALARTLHDHTGGMLVAARMDISWSETHIALHHAALCQRLERARRSIDEAIDLNRRLVEELHPTILDNFGLPEALRWRGASLCGAASIPFHASFPHATVAIAKLPSIVIYRVAQSIVGLLVAYRSSSVTLNLGIEEGWVILSLDGVGMHDSFRFEEEAIAAALASVQNRVRSLGGEVFIHFEDAAFLCSCKVPSLLTHSAF